MKTIRDKILELLSEPLTPTEIKKKLGDKTSFGTIAYHLKNLEDECILTKEKDMKRQGQPTKYKINSKKEKKRLDEWRNLRKKALIDWLKYVKQHPFIEDKTAMRYFNENFEDEYAADSSMDSAGKGFTNLHHKITTKGEKFLKQHEHKK